MQKYIQGDLSTPKFMNPYTEKLFLFDLDNMYH